MNLTKLATGLALVLAVLAAPVAQANNWQSLDCGKGWGPTNQEAPVYPQRAAERGIEGYIVMGFAISQDGSIEDVTVVEAEPATAFVRTATKAVEAIRFPPCVRDGVAVRQTNVSIRYEFNLK